MAKSSFVLRALNLLGLDDILKLSEILHVKQIIRQKAAGEELIVWEESEVSTPQAPPVAKPTEAEAKVLEFPAFKKHIPEKTVAEGEESEEASTLVSSDLVMWQRELGRQTGERLHKRDAFKGYNRSTEMLVASDTSSEGKPKSRIVATNGVLVNKKQA